MASGDHFVDCDTVDKVHLELKKILCKDYLDEKSCKWNFDTFKLKSQVHLKSQRERNVSSASEIWDMLESKKPSLLKPGYYKVLTKLVEDIDVYMADIITEAEEKIEFIKKSEDNGSSRKRRKRSDGESVGPNAAEHPDRRCALPKYDVKERKRGTVLVFCNVSVKNCDDLEGYDQDAANLQQMFRKLQFKVDILNNKDEKDILDELEKCRKKNYSDQSAFICCFLSHGGSNAVTKESFFRSSDGKAIYIEDVMAMFTNENCPSLVGKPKIFLVQACRGTEKNKGTVAANMGYTGTPHLIPNFSDYLLFNSTVLTHVSWVHEDEGSFFIRNFCEKMKEHHSKYDIMTICTLVTGAVAADGDEDTKQVPEIKSTLRKLLFL